MFTFDPVLTKALENNRTEEQAVTASKYPNILAVSHIRKSEAYSVTGQALRTNRPS